MPAHDAYLRRTPWERLLPDPSFPERHFPPIEDEVRAHPEAEDDPGAFALLESTRRALAELRDPGGGAQDAGTTHALLLFHAWHLHRAGLHHVLVTVPVSRWAVEGAAAGDPTDAGPGAPTSGSEDRPDGGAGEDAGLPDAVYVQLPQHLFWIREDAEDRPVSLDGFFRTVRADTLHVLAVGALHGPGGTGFRVLPLPGVPLADAPAWITTAMREDGDDFRSEIPGAELEGLYEVRTAGELLKLVARLDRFTTRFPEGRVASPEGSDTSPEDGPSDASSAEPPDPAGAPGGAGDGPAPAGAPYTRLVLT